MFYTDFSFFTHTVFQPFEDFFPQFDDKATCSFNNCCGLATDLSAANHFISPNVIMYVHYVIAASCYKVTNVRIKRIKTSVLFTHLCIFLTMISIKVDSDSAAKVSYFIFKIV